MMVLGCAESRAWKLEVEGLTAGVCCLGAACSGLCLHSLCWARPTYCCTGGAPTAVWLVASTGRLLVPQQRMRSGKARYSSSTLLASEGLHGVAA